MRNGLLKTARLARLGAGGRVLKVAEPDRRRYSAPGQVISALGDPRVNADRDHVDVTRALGMASEELKSRFAFVFAPSRQRDTAHRPIRTGRPHARRRFGYWGEQIG